MCRKRRRKDEITWPHHTTKKHKGRAGGAIARRVALTIHDKQHQKHQTVNRDIQQAPSDT